MPTEILTVLVIVGAGFIGSAVIRELLLNMAHDVINVDKFTYAGNLDSLAEVAENPLYSFVQADICYETLMKVVFEKYQLSVVMHLTAESHVYRSIDGPAEFIHTSVIGTLNLLDAAKNQYSCLSANVRQQFRFHHISTDEVNGDLHGTDALFTESTPYSPSLPYSASKASSDHLVRAWHRIYDLPVVLSNCSNNYGPNVFTNQSATKDLNLVVEPNILSEFTQIFEQDFLNLNSLTGINFIKSLGVSEA